MRCRGSATAKRKRKSRRPGLVLGRAGELTKIMPACADVPNEERPVIRRLINQLKSEVESRIAVLSETLKHAEMERSLGEARLDVDAAGCTSRADGSIRSRSAASGCSTSSAKWASKSSNAGTSRTTSTIWRAQLPRRSSGARDARYVSSSGRDAPANAHFQRPDPRDGRKAATARNRMPGECYRRDKHQRASLADVSRKSKASWSISRRRHHDGPFKRRVEPEFLRASSDPTPACDFVQASSLSPNRAQVDISRLLCHGAGCRVLQAERMTEVLGSGMIDPNVLRAVADARRNSRASPSAWASERTSLLKLGVDDLRLFFETTALSRPVPIRQRGRFMKNCR